MKNFYLFSYSTRNEFLTSCSNWGGQSISVFNFERPSQGIWENKSIVVIQRWSLIVAWCQSWICSLGYGLILQAQVWGHCFQKVFQTPSLFCILHCNFFPSINNQESENIKSKTKLSHLQTYSDPVMWWGAVLFALIILETCLQSSGDSLKTQYSVKCVSMHRVYVLYMCEYTSVHLLIWLGLVVRSGWFYVCLWVCVMHSRFDYTVTFNEKVTVTEMVRSIVVHVNVTCLNNYKITFDGEALLHHPVILASIFLKPKREKKNK